MRQKIVEYFYWLILILIIDTDVNFHRIPVGYYSCIVILGAISSVESASNCRFSEDGKSADCSNLIIQQIPDDLDSKITSLDLSSNPFTELRENSFKKYTQLTSLMLRDLQLQTSVIDLYLFRPLKNLKVLNLSGSDFTPRAYFYYPENLRILDITKLGVKDADISRLKFLQQLHAKDNQLLEFPIPHENANLTFVNLEANMLETLTHMRLALSCKLLFLNVRLHPDAKIISSESRLCLCKRANLWITSFKIKGEILPCKPAATDEQCDEKFSDEALSALNECKTRDDKKTSSSWIYFVLIVIFVLALIGSSGAGYYFYTTKIKPASSSSEQTRSEPDGSSKVDIDED